MPRLNSRLEGLTPVVHGGLDITELNRNNIGQQGVIDLSANINPYGPPASVAAAIQRVSLERYPDSNSTALRLAIAGQLGLAPENLVIGNGSVELIYSLCQAYLEPGSCALIIGPTFGEYVHAARLNGASVIEYTAPASNGFQPEIEAISSLIKKHEPRLIFLCNPNNPTGVRLDKAVIRRFLENVQSVNGLLILDEAYASLADTLPEEAEINPAELIASGSAVILRSLTKEFALPGLRLGYAIVPSEVNQALQIVRPPWSVNSFAQEIGGSLLSETSYRTELRQRLTRDKNYLIEKLTELGAEFVPGTANFILLKVGQKPTAATECRQLLLQHKVIVRDCTSFGLGNYIRIAVASPEHTDRFILAYTKWLEKQQVRYNLPNLLKTGAAPKLAKTLMVQGTASNVGKSIITAGLCRVFAQQGLRVAPFKAQNMALNSYITKEGGEIGRAQAVQAEACGIEPSVHMNPILLKPEGHMRSQVVVRGKVQDTLSAKEYYKNRQQWLTVVEESLNHLRQEYDLVVIEGAGSPAEVNLKSRDIVNMRVAKLAGSPVLLVSDIDRGGIFASLVGTLDLLEPDERALVKGLIINKFRGDPDLFSDGVEFLEKRTHKQVLGVLPYFTDIKIAEEDSVVLDTKPSREPGTKNEASLDICVIRLPHLANFDDFDPLELEPGVTVRYVNELSALGKPDLVILPGTKTTIADLQFLQDSGLAQAVKKLVETGTPVIGICGGYQMLGQRIDDPEQVESRAGTIEGLGLLPLRTIFHPEKMTCKVSGTIETGRGLFQSLNGLTVSGYEIHMGRTELLADQNGYTDSAEPVLRLSQREGAAIDSLDGFVNERGNIWGTYLHGLFANDNLRHGLLANLLKRKGIAQSPFQQRLQTFSKDHEYDRLAAFLKQNLNTKLLQEIVGL